MLLALTAVIGSAVGTAIENTAEATIRQVAQKAAREEVRAMEVTTPGGATTPRGAPAIVKTTQAVAQTIQATITAIGIVLGGGWAYFTFLQARGFAGTVRTDVELKKVLVDQADRRTAVVSVRIENVGRTQILQVYTQILLVPVTDAQLLKHSSAMAVIPGSLIPELASPTNPEMPPPLGYPAAQTVFEGQGLPLEPGEDAVEDVLLPFGPYHTAKVEVVFFGQTSVPGRFLRIFGITELVREWTSRRTLSLVGETEEHEEEGWM